MESSAGQVLIMESSAGQVLTMISLQSCAKQWGFVSIKQGEIVEAG